MHTIASNGPLSASRQARARASRWNWSQETGKDLREPGWAMVHPDAKSCCSRRLDSLFRPNQCARGSETGDSAKPMASLLPKSHASRYSAQKVLFAEAASADKTGLGSSEG